MLHSILWDICCTHGNMPSAQLKPWNTDRAAAPGLHTSVVMLFFPLKREGHCQKTVIQSTWSSCVTRPLLLLPRLWPTCSSTFFNGRYSAQLKSFTGQIFLWDFDLKTPQQPRVEQFKGKHYPETGPFILFSVRGWNPFSPCSPVVLFSSFWSPPHAPSAT